MSAVRTDPRRLLRDSAEATGVAVTLAELAVLPVLIEGADDSGRCTFAMAEAAAEAGMSRLSTGRALARLTARGLINYQPRMGRSVRQTVTVKT